MKMQNKTRIMGRSPSCDDVAADLKKGPWTPEEDQKLVDYIQNHGHGSWRTLPKHAGLNRCGKSCRLRWINYLRPDIKRGRFSHEEEQIIIRLHSVLGNKWSAIANHLPGRTDNEIKNFWNTHLRKKLLQMGIDPVTHKPRTDLNLLEGLAHLLCRSNCGHMMNSCDRLLVDSENVAKLKLLQGLLQSVANYPPNMAALNLMGQPMAGDFQLNWLQQSKSEIDALVDGSLGHVHDPRIPLPSCFSNLGELQALCNYEALKVTCAASFEEQATINGFGFASEMPGLTHVNDNSYTTTTNINNSTTNSYISSTLIPTQTTVLATSGVDQTMPPQINQAHDLPTHSTISTSFEAWEELINLDDQTNAYQWTDFIDSQTHLQ